MNFYFPDLRALCTAENTSHTLHNILTLRGAVVRDAHAWAHYLTETIDLWGDELDVVFASHHWPTWERERAVEFLAMQRDMYLYLHDQTLRLHEPGLRRRRDRRGARDAAGARGAWHTHGYYGSVSHNVKAIYQRYIGWYDGNPANLWPHPPVEAARRYVDGHGRRRRGGRGRPDRPTTRATTAGSPRCSTTSCSPTRPTPTARALQADALEQLGFGAENGTWRNAYLAGAHELRDGNFGTPTATAAPPTSWPR